MIAPGLYANSVIAVALCLVSACSPSNTPHSSQVVIYPAAQVITIDPQQPFAEAVATRGDRIVGVGKLSQLKQQFSADNYQLDASFADKVIMPGFVEPHLHPSLAAIVLPMNIVAAMEWPTPRGTSVAVRSHDAFIARLKELNRETDSQWLMAWGYHALYHGKMSREILDEVSRIRPIMVWQRSVHEMYFNTKALEVLELTEEDFAGSEHADWENGHLWEAGLFSVGQPMLKRMASPAGYLRGLGMMSEILHQGGLTTVAEQGFPQTSVMMEYWTLWWELGQQTPFRFVLIPNAMFLLAKHGSAQAAEEAASEILQRGNRHIIPIKHMKYYADGAIFSQLMQMSEPYLDGHHGEWLMPPQQQSDVLQAFWEKGWDIHIHVNGDAGLDTVLDEVQRQQQINPAPEKRVVLEHYGYARPDQHARVQALGIAVSNNPYYVYELAPIYAENGLGPERAADISPMGELARAGVPISFHSDYPMAPAQPLTLVWAAVNRIGSDGKVWGEHQKLPLDLALRAITIEGAWSLGMEDEIGSIEVGKKADFTILEHSPYSVDPTAIKDIQLWGTVFEGRHFPL